MPLGCSRPSSFLPSAPSVTFAQRRLVRQDVRQVEHLELLDAERAELGERRRQHLHRAELQRLELLVVLVELRVRIDLNLDLAVGVLLGQLLELQRALALRRVGRHHVAELDDDRALRERRRGERQRHGGAQYDCDFFHGVSLPFHIVAPSLAQYPITRHRPTIVHGTLGPRRNDAHQAGIEGVPRSFVDCGGASAQRRGRQHETCILTTASAGAGRAFGAWCLLRRGRGLSEPAHPCGRALAARRPDRRGRARAVPGNFRDAASAGCDRQQGRRHRRARQRLRGEGGA